MLLQPRRFSRSIAILFCLALSGLSIPHQYFATAINRVQPQADAGPWRMGAARRLSREAEPALISKAELDETVAAMQQRQRVGAKQPAKGPALVRSGERIYAVVNMEFRDAAACLQFNAPGVSVLTRFERFADVFVRPNDRQAIAGVYKAAGLVRAEFASLATAPPPPRLPRRLPSSRGEEFAEEIVRGGAEGLTGKGTIIAIVDSSLDFHNPDFITYDAAGKPASRLLYLWDTTASGMQGDKAPYSFPNGASIGRVYTRDQLTADLRANVRRIPVTDVSGHGTACAGIAAGNGNNAKGRREVIGVAPEADLIAVRIGGTPEGGLENGFALGAIWEWLDRAAGARPLVISCSFGRQRGGHDGARVEERQINARFPLNAAGRAILFSAGNDAGDAKHAEISFRGKNAPARILWSGSPDGAKLEVYFDSADVEDLHLAAAGRTEFKVTSAEINPFTKQASAEIIVGPGRGGLYFYNDSGKAATADIYITGGSFAGGLASPGKMISTPGSADHAITVGSYVWNRLFRTPDGVGIVPNMCAIKLGRDVDLEVGALSCYSNHGFNRTGRVKPSIVAPGEVFHASYARLPNGKGAGARKTIPDSSGKYIFFNGTSAATPYAAGVVALLMQRRPQITLGEIHDLLKSQATRDARTGRLPNPAWGNGKLDPAAVKKILRAGNP